MSEAAPVPAVAVRIRESLGRHSVNILRTYGIVLAFILLVIAVTAAQPSFLTKANLLNITGQWAPAGIMAVGMTYVILTGGFDLSIAALMTLCAVTAAALAQNLGPGVAFCCAFSIGLVVGLANGLLITRARVNAFIATLGVGFVVAGVTFVGTDLAYVVDREDFKILGTGRWEGFPYSGMILIGFLVIGGLVLSRTTYGQSIYAVGGNAEASRLVGIRVRTVVTSTYVFSGFCAALAGSIVASRVGSAEARQDPSMLFDVITIVVVGGTSLAGGFGSMWRTAIGLGIIATLSNGFNLIGVDPNYQDIVKGLIIVGALGLDAYARRLATRGRE